MLEGKVRAQRMNQVRDQEVEDAFRKLLTVKKKYLSNFVRTRGLSVRLTARQHSTRLDGGMPETGPQDCAQYRSRVAGTQLDQ
jgi:hypothetical protein